MKTLALLLLLLPTSALALDTTDTATGGGAGAAAFAAAVAARRLQVKKRQERAERIVDRNFPKATPERRALEVANLMRRQTLGTKVADRSRRRGR